MRYAGELDLQHQVVEALFQAYFVDGRDIGDAMTLLDIGSAAGLERGALADYMESKAGIDEVAREDEMARRMGVEGVPCFIFERKYVISGAQAPEIFLQVFEMIERDQSGAAAEAAEEQS